MFEGQKRSFFLLRNVGREISSGVALRETNQDVRGRCDISRG